MASSEALTPLEADAPLLIEFAVGRGPCGRPAEIVLLLGQPQGPRPTANEDATAPRYGLMVLPSYRPAGAHLLLVDKVSSLGKPRSAPARCLRCRLPAWLQQHLFRGRLNSWILRSLFLTIWRRPCCPPAGSRPCRPGSPGPPGLPRTTPDRVSAPHAAGDSLTLRTRRLSERASDRKVHGRRF